MRRRTFLAAAGAAAGAAVVRTTAAGAAAPDPLVVVVTDPLAAPLSCPCVKGYAQRDYAKLAAHLEQRLGRPVALHFAESLAGALRKKTGGKADVVVGKDSVVRFEAAAAGLPLARVAALTGKDGATTQTGLVVVAAADPALSADALKGYRVVFGEPSADEKHAAALDLLKDLGVSVPATPETCVACSDGATRVIDLHKRGERAATVISSYAKPLLEGCGTIKKGDLRVVGETDPVPFVAAFVRDSLPAADRAAVADALLGVGRSPDLCAALESKAGFVPPPPDAKKK